MKRNRKLPNTDGLGPLEKKKLRQAIRQIWQRSHSRRLVVKRAWARKDEYGDDWWDCENEECRRRVPKITVDHIIPAGEVDAGFIARMFVPSTELMALCQKCHSAKTKSENAALRQKKKNIRKEKITKDDF